jgi:hypothetical protein
LSEDGPVTGSNTEITIAQMRSSRRAALMPSQPAARNGARNPGAKILAAGAIFGPSIRIAALAAPLHASLH